MQLVEITSSVAGSIADEKLSREVVLGGSQTTVGSNMLISSPHFTMSPLSTGRLFIFQILRNKQTANEQEV